MQTHDLRSLIDAGDTGKLKSALESAPGLVNQSVSWHLNQDNESSPLHYVCDSVFNGWLSEERATDVATLLLEHGADVEGTAGQESPLLGATSLGVEPVAKLLIEGGANIEASGVFGARPLHWAAAMGLPSTVEALLERGAEMEARCIEFDSTPLYWAVVGAGPSGPNKKQNPLRSAKVLIDAGASVDTANKENLSALECARQDGSDDMVTLLAAALNNQGSDRAL